MKIKRAGTKDAEIEITPAVVIYVPTVCGNVTSLTSNVNKTYFSEIPPMPIDSAMQKWHKPTYFQIEIVKMNNIFFAA